MAKTKISKNGVPETETEGKTSVEGEVAAPPAKVAGSLLKIPASRMDKDTTLKFLGTAILTLVGLSIYTAMLHIGLHFAVSDPCAMEAETGIFLLCLNSVIDMVVSFLGIVYQMLKVL